MKPLLWWEAVLLVVVTVPVCFWLVWWYSDIVEPWMRGQRKYPW